jgi:hypothetical protein
MKRFKDTLNISDLVARLGRLCGPPWLLYGLPPLIAFLLYLPVLHGGLVWDDPLYLYHPLYRHPPNWSRILTTPFVLSPNYFRPLVVVTFVLGGVVPWLQHLVNLLLHVLNTVLVTLLAARLNGRRLGESVWPALVAPLLYAVHPALVEGVAFISGRFDLMLTTFLLLALLADLALRDRPRLASPAVGLCVFLAALCKEMAAGFLLVLPLWHLATGGTPASFRNLIRRQWSVYLAVLLAMAACLGLRYAALGYLYLPGAGNPVPVGSPLQHALLAARSLAEYILLALWPFTAPSTTVRCQCLWTGCPPGWRRRSAWPSWLGWGCGCAATGAPAPWPRRPWSRCCRCSTCCRWNWAAGRSWLNASCSSRWRCWRWLEGCG